MNKPTVIESQEKTSLQDIVTTLHRYFAENGYADVLVADIEEFVTKNIRRLKNKRDAQRLVEEPKVTQNKPYSEKEILAMAVYEVKSFDELLELSKEISNKTLNVLSK